MAEELIKKRADYDKLRNRTQALKTELAKLNGDLQAYRAIAASAPRGAAPAAGGPDAPRAGGGVPGSMPGTGEDEDDGVHAPLLSLGVGGAGAAAALSNNPLMKRARALSSRLDKTALKYEEVLSIKRTYEGIVARLRDERQGYDAQVGALERELAAKSKDYAELQTLASDAVRVYEASQAELLTVRTRVGGTAESRAREIREREGMARARGKHAEAALARERARRDLLAEVAGDLGISEERALIASVDAAKAQRNSLNEQANVVRRKLDAYEGAWRRIREATGVTDIAEVTAKMAAQVGQHASLAGLSRDNANRLESVREEIGAFSRLVQELRFSSGGGEGRAEGSAEDGSSPGGEDERVDDGPRESASEHESSMGARLLALRERSGAQSSSIMEVRMGVSHVSDSLAHARAALGMRLSARPGMGDEGERNLVEELGEISGVLSALLRTLAVHTVTTGEDLLEPYGGLGLAPAELSSLAGGVPLKQMVQATSSLMGRRRSVANAEVAMGGGGEAGRTNMSGGAAATFARIVPSPAALAAMGLRDEDLLTARSFNYRVVPNASGVAPLAPLGGGENHAAIPEGSKPSSAGGDGLAALMAHVKQHAVEVAAPAFDASAGEAEEEDRGTLSRDAIKRSAVRAAHSHRPKAAPKEGGEEKGAPSSAPSGAKKKGMAGPPRHQY